MKKTFFILIALAFIVGTGFLVRIVDAQLLGARTVARVPQGGTGLFEIESGAVLIGNGTGNIATVTQASLGGGDPNVIITGGFLRASTTGNVWLFPDGFLSQASSTLTGNASTTGVHQFGAIRLNGDHFTDLTGTGLQLTAGALTATLGTDIDLASAEVTGILAADNGGTGISSYSAGDFIYAIGATTLSRLAAQDDAVLTMSGTNPDWQARNDILGTTNQLTVSNGTNVVIGNGTDVTLSIPSLFIVSNFISQASSTFSAGLQVAGAFNASSTSFFSGNSIFNSNVGIGTTTPDTILTVNGTSTLEHLLGAPLLVRNLADRASNQVAQFHANNRATAQDQDDGYFSFYVDDDNGLSTEFARMEWRGDDVTNDSKDGRIELFVMFNNVLDSVFTLTGTNGLSLDSNIRTGLGSETSPSHTFGNDPNTGMSSAVTDALILSAGAVEFITLVEVAGQDELVFNEDGDDIDLRVEVSGQTHALFVQGSDGNVGIGTSSPTEILSVQGNGLFSGNLIGANFTATGTLAVTGAATLSSTLSVSGLSTFAGFISTASSTISGGGLTVQGALNASSTLVVSSSIVIEDAGTGLSLITGTSSPAVNIASDNTDAFGNSFDTATSSFLLKNDPEAFTLIGFFCKATSSPTTAQIGLVRFGDNNNWTETGSCDTTGVLTRTVTNNTFSIFEDFVIQASSTGGDIKRMTITTITNKDI